MRLLLPLVLLLIACQDEKAYREEDHWVYKLSDDPESCFAGPFPMFVKNFGLDCLHLTKDPETGVVQGRDPLFCSGPALPSRDEYEEDLSRRVGEEHTTEKYGCQGDCDFISISNVMDYAEQLLWPIVADSEGSLGRAPCGGEANCFGVDRDRSLCYVTVTDCRMGPPDYTGTLVRVELLECSGLRSCKMEGRDPDSCCHPVGPPEANSSLPPPSSSRVTSSL
jgi:hypothetical protein